MLIRLLWLSVAFWVCFVVYIDCRWNCVFVQYFLMLDGGIVAVFSSL
jgi:hypothetical protein